MSATETPPKGSEQSKPKTPETQDSPSGHIAKKEGAEASAQSKPKGGRSGAMLVVGLLLLGLAFGASIYLYNVSKAKAAAEKEAGE